jgi:hypothetical protein
MVMVVCVWMGMYVCVLQQEQKQQRRKQASKQQAYVQLTVTTQTSRKRSLGYESQFPDTLHTVDTCHT